MTPRLCIRKELGVPNVNPIVSLKEAKMQQKQAQRDRKRAAGGTEAPVSVPKSPSVDSGVAQGENETSTFQGREAPSGMARRPLWQYLLTHHPRTWGSHDAWIPAAHHVVKQQES